MMNKKKQIEEMAVILSVGECTNCEQCDSNDKFNCPHLYHAELLYDKGYRKESEVEYWTTFDIFEELEQII